MPISTPKIIYTKTDEAPALATYSFLPIVKAFVAKVGVNVEVKDISLAARVLSAFPEYLTVEQQQPDALAELGELTQTPTANMIKLPNISASIPQLKATIKELQHRGYALPDYPNELASTADEEVKLRYDKVKGSAVNPVLREGNSDRRAPASVKQYARQNPHTMGNWSTSSKSHVASMTEGDFYGSEQSITAVKDGHLTIEHRSDVGKVTVLNAAVPVLAGEIVDVAVMSRLALRTFLKKEVVAAKEQGVLFSAHLKATMMKVSDPIIFGHIVSVFFDEVFEKHAATFSQLGVDPNNGLSALEQLVAQLPDEERLVIESDIAAFYKRRPALAMVDSDKGITNLHVPSDVIIDASMPAAIRSSGQMWGPDGQLHDMKAVIPDRSYAGIYQEVIDFCRQHGAFDPTTMGTIPNVGLMAQKAEEYGSHDKTFQMPSRGVVCVSNEIGEVVFECSVEEGDIWRMCQTKDAPIQDWVKLAVVRARLSATPAVFWLDANRSHDQQLIEKVNQYLQCHDTVGLEILIKSPVEAMRYSLERLKAGKDTISVTGNVLRDYLTDLFPILELGTSAKMLSVVPLMNGGGLFETGAGGSAPKHVQQLVKENYLRWDSLGEFLALSASLEHLAMVYSNDQVALLAKCLDKATGKLLQENKSPARRLGELDNRGSHFYLALYWAQAVVSQTEDTTLSEQFVGFANDLQCNEQTIVAELNSGQGAAVSLEGYYLMNDTLATKVMRPSSTFNQVIDVFT